MENITVFISSLTAFLSPILPYLLKLGDKSAESAAEKFGEATWNKATTVWAKLSPNLSSKGDIKVAVEQVANKPDSEARQAVLKEELETLLRDNPNLITEISEILQNNIPVSSNSVQITQNIKNAYMSQIIGQVNGGH
jgi:hypothetical protein